MQRTPCPVLWLALLAAFVWTSSARASQRSELLVAQGEVAYNAGRVDEARGHFEDALTADPSDDVARAWLDVIASRVPSGPGRGERPEQEARIWDLETGTGIEYDSNVELAHKNGPDDAAFLFTLAGHVTPWRDDRTLLRLDYDFFQSLHTDVTDFDVRSNRFRATAARAITPALWAGVQGGYDHTTLHTHAYLQEPWVMPYFSLLESDRGATQVLYRYGYQNYMGSPFGGPPSPYDRTGSANAFGVTQLLYFFDHRLAATLGYTYEEATPYNSSGNDFARHSHQGLVGLRFPGWWRTLVELDYVYRYDGYTKLNSAAGYRKKRQDDGNYLATYLRRPIIPHLDALLSWFVTVNGSNIALYDYNRNVLALELRYTF